VAIHAKDRDVPAGEREAGFLVTGERKLGRLKSLHTVTRLAAVLERGICKLALVNILMAVLTLCFRDFEQRVFVLWPLRQMAFVARHGHVFTFKGILCRCMIFHTKGRGLETVDVMARRTFATVRAAAELPLMGILMAIHAFCEWHGSFKISVLVAVRAIYFRMFAEQRKFCCRVIESL